MFCSIRKGKPLPLRKLILAILTCGAWFSVSEVFVGSRVFGRFGLNESGGGIGFFGFRGLIMRLGLGWLEKNIDNNLIL